MISKIKNTLLVTLLLLNVLACNNTPKVIKSRTDSSNSEKKSEIFSSEPSSIQTKNTSINSLSNNIHTIKVNEVLKTSKYLYINVTENKEEFWIATRLMDITVGETYYYKGGLLKTNYENKELQRVFKKIYLISSNLVSSNHSTNSNNISKSNFTPQKQTSSPAAVSVKTTYKKIEVKGSIKIAELVNNYKKYEGKTIQVSGTCVKINPNIMNRNWIHLKDGSKDDFDLVITSDSFVDEGSIITIKATVSINKDFGAGYKYDLILENGTIVP